MQIFTEPPTSVVMFLGGLFCYMFVEWLKSCAAASARRWQKLEGVCQTEVGCTAAGAATTMSPLDLAAGEEAMKQHKPNSRTEFFRNRKVARKACRAIRPDAAHDKPSAACDVNVGSSEKNTTAVSLDMQRKAGGPTGTSVADKPQPSVMLAEPAAGSVREQGDAPADDGRASRWECMTANINDTEADNEAEAEATFAFNMQEAGEGDHEHLQGWCADAEQVCQQPLLNLEQEPLVQGDSTEEPQPEVGQHVEEQDEQSQAAPADEEQGCFCEPEVGEWAEKTGAGCMKDHGSQPQLGHEHLSREEELRRVLISDWAEASDEEDWSVSGHEGIHHSCPQALDSSASQHEIMEHDNWSMPFANNLTPTPQSINSWPRKWKQGSRLDNNDWMTPVAPADGKMPGWITDDQWFGNGPWGNHGQQLDDGDSAGWFGKERWFSNQWRNSYRAETDCWMTPFDELIRRTTPEVITASGASVIQEAMKRHSSPIGPTVCIWNAGCRPALEAGSDRSEGNGAAEIFTDGQRVFQPVPSATGQPLFTDGNQLYASVCVVAPPGEAVDPILATACSAAMCGPGAANLSSSPGSTVSLMADWSDDELSCTAVGAED